MLGGKMSNADEDEVEEELAALEAEATRAAPLPNVPNTQLPERQAEVEEQESRTKQAERRAMLAA